MAALCGLGVDNCVIELDGPEAPIMDGSAAPFVDAIDQVGVAFLTAVYETLVTMAAGALVAALLLVIQGGDEGMRWKSVGLVVLAGIPILPGVFNRVVERIASRFQRVGLSNPPKPSSRDLLVGLLGMAVSWMLTGNFVMYRMVNFKI